MTEHKHASGCGCCLMSRRCFLAASSAAMAAPLVGCATGGSPKSVESPGNLGEYIDIASFRPKPKVRIVSAVVREKPPYWLGWPGTSYDVEGHRKEYAECFAKSAERIGVDLEEEPKPLESEEAVNAFCNKLKSEKPDAVLINLQSGASWPWTDTITKTEIPTIIFAPVGMGFTMHVLVRSRRPGVFIISSLETGAMDQAFRMIRAKRQLEESRLLVVKGDERSESALDRLGTSVRYVPRPTLHELFARMPETDEVRDVARQIHREADKIIEPDRQDILNAARSYVTAKRLMHNEESNAITTDCLGMVSTRVVPTPPCMAASIFQDAGVTYGCEADLFAAISLMTVSYLFDKPGFMQDPVPETVKNLLIGAHCTCATRLNGFDQPPEELILRSHSESDLGVATQVLWQEGQRVTLLRYKNAHELILDTGTVVGNVQTPPAGGCRTSVEIAMDRMEDARDVLGFHQVIFYGDHRRDVEAFCQMYGIQVVHSPEKAPASQIGIALVSNWNVIGAFANPDHKGHDAVYPPERAIDLTETYQGIDGPVEWRAISGSGDLSFVDLSMQFSSSTWATAYALNYLWIENDMDVQAPCW